MSSPFKVISTFSGCGGSSTGYRMAGGEVLLAVEWDDNAVATYKANYPATRIYHGDIGKLSVDVVLHQTGLKVGELDILDGSPPCQGFSTAGKRDFNDTRNQLFKEFVRLLRGLKPKVFVMENVSGMVKGKMKLIFAEILKELKESGYRVKARLMNAMYYGVPQSRQRMIFIGVREDLRIEPSHPNPQTKPISVRTAWDGLINTEYARPLATVGSKVWDHIKPGQNGSAYRQGYYFGSPKLDYNRPAPTMNKSLSGIGGLLHPEERRTITIQEAKRIHSYPDNYIFLGTFTEKYARIGNSVPPLFMKAIATHINENILLKINGVNTE